MRGRGEDYLAVVAGRLGHGCDATRRFAARVFFDPGQLRRPNVAAFVAY